MIEKVTVKTERGHISVSYNFKHSYSEELQRRALARARKAVREDFPDSEGLDEGFQPTDWYVPHRAASRECRVVHRRS